VLAFAVLACCPGTLRSVGFAILYAPCAPSLLSLDAIVTRGFQARVLSICHQEGIVHLQREEGVFRSIG